MTSYDFSSFSGPDESPARLQAPLSKDAVMEELTKPVSARGRGKGKKRSLVKPPNLPNFGQSFFGSFDDSRVPWALPPSEAKQSPRSLSRRRTLGNIDELRRSEESQEEEEEWLGGWLAEHSLTEMLQQVARLKENSARLETAVVPQLARQAVNKLGADYEAITETSRAKLGSLRESLQRWAEVGVASGSTAELERKYRELEVLESQYRAVRGRLEI